MKTPYPYQEEVINKIRNAIDNDKNVILEMPTGSGKTFTVLYALQVYDHFMVNTRTVSQYQPWEREAKELGITYAGLIGKARVCRKPYTKVKVGNKVKYKTNKCVQRSGNCEYLAYFISYEELREKGLYKYCRESERCPYFKLKNDKDAKMYLSTYVGFFFSFAPVKHHLVVFDEAHNLMNLNDFIEFSISKEELYELIEKRKDEELEQRYLIEVKQFLDGKLNKIPTPLTEDLSDEAEEIYNVLKEFDPETWRIYRDNEKYRVKPIDPSYLLRKLSSYQWIMMSGTMFSDDYIQNVLHLDNYERISAKPFEPNITYYLYDDEKLNYNFGKRDGLKQKTVEVVKNLKSPEGITLVVVSSYQMAEWFRGIADYIENPKTRLDEVPRKGLIVAVARGKITEGVEFVEGGRSLIRRVIIVNLPYPQTNDPYFKDVVDYVTKVWGQKTMWKLMNEIAFITVRQAIGRAVRGPRDKAEVYFLDIRFKSLFHRLELEVPEE
ncbi:DNA helicase [Sulfolobus virus Kamchatka 1]|uniref:ORF B494 n=1 Tax=Sulfolobus virus Kamchatka 1 TaxID=248496 RepID=Q6TDM6_9VIRU|nr:DNA helicase [Sulfolobus virus Kamchatka 1]AAQ94373.1 ORF B494 [Sulfolobus virus Kamchatka 1]